MDRWIKMSSSILCLFIWVFPPGSWLAEGQLSPTGAGGKPPSPSFAFGWLDDKNTFQAGNIAAIEIKLLDYSFNDKNFNFSSYPMNFSLSVRGKKGNSSYVSGVFPYLEGDPTFWNISFIPIWVGEFTAVITEDHLSISDSTLHFSVAAGHTYPSACVASWGDLLNEFVAGTKAYLFVLPKDAFGNNIPSGTNGPSKDYFMLSASYDNGSTASVLEVGYDGWNDVGYISLEFIPMIAGRFLLHVYADNKTLSGSPLPFMVKPGPLDIANSVGKWKYGTNYLQIFSQLEIFIHQQDLFGNLVPGFFPLDARVVQKATNLSIPVSDLFFEEVAQGIQLLSFVVSEPGEFMLTIFDSKLNTSISNRAYDFTVFTGYCHGSNSFANGSGLAGSHAGMLANFTVYLEDMYHNPSPIEAEKLHVQILSKNGTFDVCSVIFPLRNTSERGPVAGQSFFANRPAGSLPALPANEDQTIAGEPTTRASEFNVAYTPKISGDYEIWVFCGNIPLNNGHSYLMKVSPGLVNTSLSSVSRFTPIVKRLAKNEVLVQLVDSFSNPILSHQAKLAFQIDSINNSSFMRWAFMDNEDGSYIGYYLARDVGAYNICISFEDKHLPPCPFEIHVHEKEYFSEVRNDSISVWEDESVAFDVLLNDYVAGGLASIIESSTPFHGSLLLYGQQFRYTPYKGFYGNDSFSYQISDINNNVATGTVFISVLCKPPQFVSVPVQLHVTEDVISPKFSGFPGFEIMYSDMKENISVTIRAPSGTVFLSPMLMQLHQPLDNILSVSRGGRAVKDLVLAGHVEILNYALQLIQYIGNENFYGHDIINLYAMNKNGIEVAHVPVFVEPINDPPIINAPKFIFLGKKEATDRLQIFDKQRDVFEFSISDSDIFNFPDNKSHFVVTFSLEVNDGILSTTLPVILIDTAELKTPSSNQWEPLQTFVTISNHFVLKGKGVRFRGTVGNCNNAMQHLFYQGGEHDAVLTVTVNDMGNYGCYSDCTEMMSLPLYTEVQVNLIKRRPVSSMTSLLLGSAIIIEIVMMLLLGGVLLLFICKCMRALYRERSRGIDDVTSTGEDNIDHQTMNAASSQNAKYFEGRSTPFSLKCKHLTFRQQSHRGFKSEEYRKDGLLSSSQFIDVGLQLVPLHIERHKVEQSD